MTSVSSSVDVKDDIDVMCHKRCVSKQCRKCLESLFVCRRRPRKAYIECSGYYSAFWYATTYSFELQPIAFIYACFSGGEAWLTTIPRQLLFLHMSQYCTIILVYIEGLVLLSRHIQCQETQCSYNPWTFCIIFLLTYIQSRQLIYFYHHAASLLQSFKLCACFLAKPCSHYGAIHVYHVTYHNRTIST